MKMIVYISNHHARINVCQSKNKAFLKSTLLAPVCS